MLNLLIDAAKRRFSSANPEWVGDARTLTDALFAGDAAKVRKIVNDMLEIFISTPDSPREDFYPDCMTVVLSAAGSNHGTMKSRQEGGDGRFSLTLMRDSDRSAVIMKFKKTDSHSLAAQFKLCDTAIEEISLNRYDSNLRQDGYERVLKYGLAFFERDCEVKLAED